MFSDFLWNSFAASGNIELYLEYKEYENDYTNYVTTAGNQLGWEPSKPEELY